MRGSGPKPGAKCKEVLMALAEVVRKAVRIMETTDDEEAFALAARALREIEQEEMEEAQRHLEQAAMLSA